MISTYIAASLTLFINLQVGGLTVMNEPQLRSYKWGAQIPSI